MAPTFFYNSFGFSSVTALGTKQQLELEVGWSLFFGPKSMEWNERMTGVERPGFQSKFYSEQLKRPPPPTPRSKCPPQAGESLLLMV